MASFINKKLGVFSLPSNQLEARRSEARLKTYDSCLDSRSWCYDVEDRRKHIFEIILKNRKRCFGQIIPFETILGVLIRNKEVAFEKLSQELKELNHFLSGAKLSPEDLRKLQKLNQRFGRPQVVSFAEGDQKETLLLKEPTIFKKIEQEASLQGLEAGPSSILSEDFIPIKESTKIEALSAKSSKTSSKKNCNCKVCTSEDEKTFKQCICELTSCKATCTEELQELERELHKTLTPQEQAQELCAKLKEAQRENELLKEENSLLKSKSFNQNEDSTLILQEYEGKLKELQEITQERDSLKEQLNDLLQGQSSEEKAVGLLNKVLEERDELQKKLDSLQEMEEELQSLRDKASRVEDLEMQLQKSSRNSLQAEDKVRLSKTKCSALKEQIVNLNKEREAMVKHLNLIKTESLNTKAFCKENDLLKIERDQLQIKLNLLRQNISKLCEYNKMKKQRDLYKKDVNSLECHCQNLRKEVTSLRMVAEEREVLLERVKDLEACVGGQEQEIETLLNIIDLYVGKQCDCESKALLYESLEESSNNTIALMMEDLEAVKDKNRQLQAITNKMLGSKGVEHDLKKTKAELNMCPNKDCYCEANQ